jgi:hypothetical protein
MLSLHLKRLLPAICISWLSGTALKTVSISALTFISDLHYGTKMRSLNSVTLSNFILRTKLFKYPPIIFFYSCGWVRQNALVLWPNLMYLPGTSL